MPRDLEEVGGELAGRLVAMAGEPEPQEGLLDEVVRLGAVRQQGGEIPPQRHTIAPRQLVEGRRVVLTGPKHQLDVGRLHSRLFTPV